MSGLLDFFGSPDAQLGLGLLAAAAPRAGGVSFGQGMQEALGYVDKQRQMKAAEMAQAQAAKYQQMQMAEYEQKRAREQEIQGLAQQFAKPAIGAAADGYGPTAPASFDRQGFGAALEAKDPMAGMAYLQSIQKQAPKLTAYKPGDSVRDDTGREVFAIPQEAKPKELPNSVREFEYGAINPEYNNWLMKGKAASAPKTSVDLRDPTAVAGAAMRLQNDYRAATKPSYARAQAYEAMAEASNNPSAKGDLTMVYSFVKALDPESVVREGEISLLNANRNIPDQIKGYAQRLSTGQSLLPHERQDLLNQARTLTQTDYKRSRNDVKAYRDNAQRLGLDPDLYAPDPYAGFKSAAEAKTATLADIAATAKSSGRTTKEVTDALRAKGYTIGGM